MKKLWKYISYLLFKKEWFTCDHWLDKLTVDSKDVLLKIDKDGLHETWQCTCTCKCGRVVTAKFAFTTDLYWEPFREAREFIEQSERNSEKTKRFIEKMGRNSGARDTI